MTKTLSRAAPATSVARPAAAATQYDVARIAGVSQAVVSRVFGSGGYVSARTRARVIAAGEKIGYIPDASARALKTRRSNIVALVVANVTNAFYPYSFDKLTLALQAQGSETMLFNASGGRNVDALLPTVIRNKPRGAVIMTAGLKSEIAGSLRQRGISTVMLNRYSEDGGSSSVACDNVAAGRLVAEQFVDAGFDRVAYIGGEQAASTNRDRCVGFVGRLRELGHAPLLVQAGAFTHEWGYRAARDLAEIARLQAVFCADDDIAMGVIDGLRYDFDRSIPEETAVVGFDDVPGAGWPTYALTTLRQPVDEMIARVLDLLDQPADAEPVHVRLPGTLVRRKTF